MRAGIRRQVDIICLDQRTLFFVYCGGRCCTLGGPPSSNISIRRREDGEFLVCDVAERLVLVFP